MTLHLVDVSRYQVERSNPLDLAQAKAAGYGIANLSLTGGRGYVSGAWVSTYRDRALSLGMGVCTYHWLDGRTSGASQATANIARLRSMFGSGLGGFGHAVDIEESGQHGITRPTWQHVRDYVDAMQQVLSRHVAIYSPDYWWPASWAGAELTPYLMAPPSGPPAARRAHYLPAYPGDDSAHWRVGYGGWSDLSIMQWGVQPLPGTGDCSLSAIRDHEVWADLTGREASVAAMDPRIHPRGAPPNFSMVGLPPNPNPQRITPALWWLVCMRLRLEPLSANGGILAIKPGYHSYGSRLPDFGLGDARTDHSIRRAPDRAGPWWKDFASAHDWTFTRAHSGNYTEIAKYTNRLRDAMMSPTDLRPDDVYAYTIGQIDNDRVVEGWNEYTDDDESGDETHLWHRHDSFRRNIIGSFLHMWKALTIDMGWTYAEWQRSVAPEEDDLVTSQAEFNAFFLNALKVPAIREEVGDAFLSAPYGNAVRAGRTVRAWIKDAHALRDHLAGDAAAAAAVPIPATAPVLQMAGMPARLDLLSTAVSKMLEKVTTDAAAEAQRAAAEQARDEGMAKAVAELGVTIRELLAMVSASGGDVDVAPIVARLDALPAQIQAAADAAGQAAFERTVERLAEAQRAEADALIGDTKPGQ